MPKVKRIAGGRERPYNALAALLRGYKLAAGMSADEIGKRLGVTADNVRHQIGKPADQWNIGQLKRYCDVLGIPYGEALDAAAK